MTTLTDDYVAALTRLLPRRQRADIARELRASLADATDERVELGASPGEAERDALAELGDPVLLAAQYTDRPTALIGPHYYGAYRRTLGMLLTIGPGVGVVVLVAQILAAVPFMTGLLVAVAVGLGAMALAALWLTAFYAVLERLPRRRAAWSPATVLRLDESTANTLGGLAFVLALIGLLVLTPAILSVVDDAGQPIPILAPGLWPAWAPVIVAGLVGAVVFALVTAQAGWTRLLAIVNAVVVVVGAALLVWWALNDLLLNRAFFAAIGWTDITVTVLLGVLVAGIVVNGIVEIVGGFRKAARTAAARSAASGIEAGR